MAGVGQNKGWLAQLPSLESRLHLLFPAQLGRSVESGEPAGAAGVSRKSPTQKLLLGPKMDLCEDGTMLDWEAVLELDEALAGWFLQAPAGGEWGWEWDWAASDLQEQQWDSEGIPAVSYAMLG